MSAPFTPGDRVRLKANHAVEATVQLAGNEASTFNVKIVGAAFGAWVVKSDWERVPKPMPALEPGMVVETEAVGASVVSDPRYWNQENVTRVGRVEWIWSKEDE